MDKTQSWAQLLNIQAGGVICLPVIMVGHLLCTKFGWQASVSAIILGNLVLLLLGTLSIYMTTAKSQSTISHVGEYFGLTGKKLFGWVLLCSTLGWFAIQLNMMTFSVQELLQFWNLSIDNTYINVILGLLLTLIMLLGIQAVNVFATLSMPLLVLTLAYAVWSAIDRDPGVTTSLPFTFLGGVSLIIGVEITAITNLPNFFQHAKSRKDGLISILLLYGCVVPLLEGIGVYLCYKSQGGSILDILMMGQGVWWNIWVASFLLLAGWTTNNTNLYSATLNTEPLFLRNHFQRRTLFLGIVGTIIACLNPVGHLEVFLKILGIGIGSLGAVMLSSFVLKKQQTPWLAFTAWFLGVFVGGGESLLVYTITQVPTLDAFIVATLVNLLIKTKGKYETAYNG